MRSGGSVLTTDDRSTLPRVSRHISIVVLAAGRSSRMLSGTRHKLLATFDGIPLIRRLVQRALASKADQVFVVTGHQGGKIKSALDGLAVTFVDNPNFGTGIASSLKVGLSVAAAAQTHAIMVLHGDMPSINTRHLDLLIDEFESNGNAVVWATCRGTRGNPVVLPSSIATEASQLSGDTGAKSLIQSSGFQIVPVEIGLAALDDVDTEEQLLAAGGRLSE